MPPAWKDKVFTLILCLAAGALTSFAFSPYDIYFLAVLGPAALIHSWSSARPGNVFGLGLFGTGVNWIHISINLFGGVNFVGAIALTFLFIAFIALYPAIVGYVSRRFFTGSAPFTYLVFIIPSLWTVGEMTSAV